MGLGQRKNSSYCQMLSAVFFSGLDKVSPVLATRNRNMAKKNPSYCVRHDTFQPKNVIECIDQQSKRVTDNRLTSDYYYSPTVKSDTTKWPGQNLPNVNSYSTNNNTKALYLYAPLNLLHSYHECFALARYISSQCLCIKYSQSFCSSYPSPVRLFAGARALLQPSL